MKKLLILLIIFGCSSSRDERLLEKSKEVHEAALDMGSKLGEKITRIEELSNQLEEPLRSAILDSVVVLNEEWKNWKASMVEVPGHEHTHSHDHDHDHNHDHHSSPDLTPSMLLKIQEVTKNRACELNARAQKIIAAIEETKGS